jgi:hypothetical protein
MRNLILLSISFSLILYSCSDSNTVTSDNAIELTGQIEQLSKQIQHLDSVQNARIDSIEELIESNYNIGKWQMETSTKLRKINTQTGDIYWMDWSTGVWKRLPAIGEISP